MYILSRIFNDIDYDNNWSTTFDLENTYESEIDHEWLEMRDDSDMNMLIDSANEERIQSALDNFDVSALQSDATVTSMSGHESMN